MTPLALNRNFDIDGAAVTLHPCKSDPNTHILDFSKHLAIIRNTIQHRANQGLPKIIVIEGKLGSGISYLIEVLTKCFSNTTRIQGDSSDFVLPKIKTGASTYIFDGAYRIDPFSISVFLDKVADTSSTAILLVHHYSEVPADIYSNVIHLQLTRDGFTENKGDSVWRLIDTPQTIS